MSVPEPNSSQSSEIAHVLFMDIVAYSTLSTSQQQLFLEVLNKLVRNTREFIRASSADQLIRLPTGDGMALVFFRDPEAPVRCALQIGGALGEHPEIKLRMGIHTGPVYRVADINANLNVAGGGINVAQRVMDCGDPGHILISKATADVLREVGGWKDSLRDLGELKVKHGIRLHVFEVLKKEEAGRSQRPKKLRRVRARRLRRILKSAIIIAVTSSAVSAWLTYNRKVHALGEADTVVLADFENMTGDSVFDDTLKTALTVALNQSPFLNVLPDSKVASTLQLMARPTSTALTPAVARELGQRAGSKVYIAGTISSLGSQYVLGLKAVNCRTGDVLVEEQGTAAAKEKVLDALGKEAAKLRGELGESLATVQKFDVPLAEATTSSLDALKAYSLGLKATREKGVAAALPYFQHAIQLDPNFASAYFTLGGQYYGMNQLERSREYYAKAFELREHASEPEKLTIESGYYWHLEGDRYKAAAAYQEMIEDYPRRPGPYVSLALVFMGLGQYEKAQDLLYQCIRLSPDAAAAYADITETHLALQQFRETRQTIQQVHMRKWDSFVYHIPSYFLDFLSGDSAAMADEQKWFADHPEYENAGLSLASDTEAYEGKLRESRELTKRAVDSAIRADSKEAGAIWEENAALLEAAFGNPVDAKRAASAGLKLAPTSRGILTEAALAYAMAADTKRAESMAQDFNKRFPMDTQVQSLWLPAIRAQLALDRKSPAAAIEDLQPAVSIEYGQIDFINNISCLYPTYIRGEAYAAAGDGKLAAGEFQKILDHSGIVWTCWTGALARLGVARANALQVETSQGADADAARLRALAAYKDFLAFWKDADPEIPILKQAKAEYARLQ